MPIPGRGRTYIPKEHFEKTVINSLRAIWALICRVSGTGNLDRQPSVRSELKGDEEGYQVVDWDGAAAEEEVESPK